MTERTAGLTRYLKEAFLLRWNLLLFGTTAVAAFLSGYADVLVPVVLATELAYLAGLVGTERFRAMIDGRVLAESQSAAALQGQADRQLQAAALFQSLERPRSERLNRLRQRCLDMRFLAHGVTGGDRPDKEADFSTPALDRLLWVFLKLLVSQQALERFLRTTDAAQIAQQVQTFQAKLAAVPAEDERLRRSLEDGVATAELRLTNFEAARRNAQFVDVELDRLEAKIQTLTEMSVSNEDPNYISSQVDAIAQSMAETEAEMRELDALTGLIADDAAPELLRRA